MKTRVVSGIILVVIMAACLFAGPILWNPLFIGISFIGLYELYRVFQMERTILGILGYVAVLCYDGMVILGYQKEANLLAILTLIAFLCAYVIFFPKFDAIKVFAGFSGFIYVGVFLSYMIRIRSLPDGFLYTLLVFICSWLNDTAAYFSGMLFGKHKLAPVLSPKKTVEGFVGGILAATLVGGLYGFLFGDYIRAIHNPTVAFAVACGIGAVISVVGDLAASAIKRNYEIKDYGTLIPGHGGIMDRFDSIIIIAPVIYVCILMFTK
ncbi:MAG: phosphatidate cytidylyltransferase [Lachnospiraceae bacterium]|nr:phosphatidate cytidylyltransferase [Lachnospiraceae bacterium]